MKNIYMLDCTLRDGGYINDWNFGRRAIKDIGRKIVLAGIEYFEAGFVRDCEYDPDRSLFDRNESVAEMIAPKNPGTKYVGMIDMGRPVSLEKLGRRQADGFDVLRVIFKKNKINEAYEYIEKLLELGYEVFAQAVGTDSYSDKEFIGLIERFAPLPVSAFYIVDSFGLIKKKQFMRLIQIADNNLPEGVMLGYHSHNNMQQAMGNASAMAEYNLGRDIILDACIFGMGRGAGNLNMELFAEYLNENFGKHYSISPMLEVIDEYLNDIYSRHFWGYSLPLYLSAHNGCHPNYALYFSSKGTLTVKSYDEILKSIPQEDKAAFTPEKAEKYYTSYRDMFIDDRQAVNELSEKLAGRNILLIGSGKSIETQREDIERFISEKKPVVISLNFISDSIRCDYVFSCHMRRYKSIQNAAGIKKIITSNVRDACEYDYMLNYSSYRPQESAVSDNSGLIFLSLLLHTGIRRVALAGLDGYDTTGSEHCFDGALSNDFTPEMRALRNEVITKELGKLKGKMELEFVTKSLYDI